MTNSNQLSGAENMALSHEDRLIKIERIEPNPSRDLDIYPIHPDRVAGLKSSYAEGDFGTIIPVRPHPTKRGFYQQACGHHRIKAMQTDGRPLEVLCRIKDMTDDEMTRVMVRENMNNYGNNPEAIADSVAAVCKSLIYWVFLAESHDDLNRILLRSSNNPFATEQAFVVAKGQLIRDGSIGYKAVLNFFGPNKADWPLTQTQVQGALAALNGTSKMAEIGTTQRNKADMELSAKKKAEIARAEEAEAKAAKAIKAEEAFNKMQAERNERRKVEREETRLLKDARDKAAAEARIAKEKADADKERRRMAAMVKERKRLEKEAQGRRASQAKIQTAQDKTAKAKDIADNTEHEYWLHTASFGLFDNQWQFDAFRQMMGKPEMRVLFPVDQQPQIIKQMLNDLAANDSMTAKGIKEWMTEQDKEFKAKVERGKREAENQAQALREASNKKEKAWRIMDEMSAAIARMSKAYHEVNEASKDPEMASLILQSPCSDLVRNSLEMQYKILPELENFFRISARKFPAKFEDEAETTEKTIN